MAMIFKLTKHSDNLISELFEKAIKELISFYKFNWVQNQPKVYIIDSREDINSVYGKDTQDWLIGWSDGRSIYLLNPENIEKESNHKYSDDLYFKLIKHELSHLFYKLVTNTDKPSWLNEGVATYVSGQVNEGTDFSNLSKFLEDPKEVGSAIYKEAGFALLLLSKEFGDEKILQYIKEIKGYRTSDEIRLKFQSVFDRDLTYDSFNMLLKKHYTKE
ncbi:hypothetical protein JXA34_01520 [Patescibacteria group bacterium]|nr:hypothetical protein [Patescibacteria group bacterium]